MKLWNEVPSNKCQTSLPDQKYRESSNKPPGGLLNFGPSGGGGGLISEGGLLEREGLIYSLTDNDRITLYRRSLKYYAALSNNLTIALYNERY